MFEHIPLWESIIAFTFFTCLFLFMLVYSKVNWIVKLLASVGSIIVFVLAFQTLNSSYGWPLKSETALPEYFEVEWIDVEEPTLYSKGAIRLWVKEFKNNASALIPRSYEVPYSKDKHKESAENMKKLMQGQKVFGTNKQQGAGDGIMAKLKELGGQLLDKLGIDPGMQPGGTNTGDTRYARNTRDQEGWEFTTSPTRTPPKDLQE